MMDGLFEMFTADLVFKSGYTTEVMNIPFYMCHNAGASALTAIVDDEDPSAE